MRESLTYLTYLILIGILSPVIQLYPPDKKGLPIVLLHNTPFPFVQPGLQAYVIEMPRHVEENNKRMFVRCYQDDINLQTKSDKCQDLKYKM